MKKALPIAFAVLWVAAVFAVIYWYTPRFPAAGEGPAGVKGVLDLRGTNGSDRLIRLDGEWEFYRGKLLSPQDLAVSGEEELTAADRTRASCCKAAGPGGSTPAAASGLEYVTVPGKWENYAGAAGDKNGNLGYGTFRLKVNMDKPAASVYGIKVHNIRASHRLFINGEPVGGSGVPGTTAASTTHSNVPYVRYFPMAGNTLDITVQVANYRFYTGGIAFPILLGTQEQIQGFRDYSIGRDMIVSTGFFLLGLYLLVLFRMRRTERSWLYFGLFTLTGCVYAMTQGEKLLSALLPSLSYEWFTRIQFGSGISTEVFLLMYAHTLLPNRIPRWVVKLCVAGVAVRLALVLLTPVQVFS
ncbi:7TM diverse intracellular signaling domain-containing protein [Paenibacillus puerhi]|uniref:7TM diverse intracellular signaling domain-containing protein n=1 Tax=Paenibacillus puerhi TaxID=2692622 RepID=UPI00135B727F|nr:7TM diverse intracellular signaling domain-containing protein [Paenibacillus puerhi]